MVTHTLSACTRQSQSHERFASTWSLATVCGRKGFNGRRSAAVSYTLPVLVFWLLPTARGCCKGCRPLSSSRFCSFPSPNYTELRSRLWASWRFPSFLALSSAWRHYYIPLWWGGGVWGSNRDGMLGSGQAPKQAWRARQMNKATRRVRMSWSGAIMTTSWWKVCGPYAPTVLGEVGGFEKFWVTKNGGSTTKNQRWSNNTSSLSNRHKRVTFGSWVVRALLNCDAALSRMLIDQHKALDAQPAISWANPQKKKNLKKKEDNKKQERKKQEGIRQSKKKNR